MFGINKTKEKRLSDALNDINAGKIKVGMNALLALGHEEYAEAQYMLGDIFEFSVRNFEEAAQWYLFAASNGHKKAMWCIANLLIIGKGAPFDPPTAVKWYLKAAENNIPEAQFVLGEFYRGGLHVEKNINTSLSWYQRAANIGFEPAQTRIKQFWNNGVFTERR